MSLDRILASKRWSVSWINPYIFTDSSQFPKIPTGEKVIDRQVGELLLNHNIPLRTGAPGSRTNHYIELYKTTNTKRKYKKGEFFTKMSGRFTHRNKLLKWNGQTGVLV